MRDFFSKVEVTKALIDDYGGPGDVFEFIKRELAIKIVSDLPIKDLEKLIEFRRVTAAMREKVLEFASPAQADRIFRYHNELHIAKIKIPD